MPAERYQIHKQQLFHWIGRDIERKNNGKKVLSDTLAQEALNHIAGSVEKGLWVKKPQVPELFTLGEQKLCLDSPIACFTEWSLGESLPHTSNYGRIGFGFPKKFVIDRGGQSVTYFRHARESLFLKSIFRALKCIATPLEDGKWQPKPGCTIDELIYLIHFAKMVRASAAVKAATANQKRKPN